VNPGAAQRILVVGAGATGGYFGGRLAEAGRDVTFLVRARRAEQLRRDGLVIASPHGDLKLTPQLVTGAELDASYDLVLFTVKAYGLDQAIADITPAIGPETMILPMLNGMRHLDMLTARFGEQRVLGGVCLVATALGEDGTIRQLNDLQHITYGDRHQPDSARMHAVDEAVRGAGFPTRLSRDVVGDMWRKWVFLASIGAITCLMRGTIGQVVSAPGGRAFAQGVVAECAAVSAAAGHPLPAAELDRTRSVATDATSPINSSMSRDLGQGYPVEADHIIGDLVDRAHALGVEVPLLELVYTHLAVYQDRLAR
jgi:2-dehydropantoate 2-reductase